MFRLLKFYADWCQPCKALQPAWDKLQEEDVPGGCIFESINIDDNPQLRQDFSVRTIPMFILVKEGKEVRRKQGAKSYSELKEWLLDEQGDLQSDVLQEQS